MVTDGTDSVHGLAAGIAGELKENHVVILGGLDFSATDLLPADLCFFGCDEVKPASFSGLEDVLRHINLAGRSGGIFTAGSEKNTAYLRGLVQDSELDIGAEDFVGEKGGDLKSWVQEVLHRS